MKKVGIFLAQGFEETEALATIDLLRRAKVEVDMVSVTGEKYVVSTHGIAIGTDKLLSEVDFDSYDMLIMPGGMPGTRNLEACEELMAQVERFYAEGKYLAAICAAPIIYGHRGMLKDRDACCYPGYEGELTDAKVSEEPVCVDGNMITSRGVGTVIPFGLKLVEILAGKDESDRISKGIVWK